uniref:Cell division protein n=1 Tax=Fusochloris perforata TaxID=106203 RepID=A0A097KPT1_9CHLO|nr:cell division protein [Fusochloris perforata]AIT95165.1 cell division protein [Fusochloris perforata]
MSIKKSFPQLEKINFIQDYRFLVKNSIQNFVKEFSNFEMILNLSLFTFAFSQMIWFNYKEQAFTFFTKNSLPGVCLPWQTLSWDTYNTVFSTNFKILDEKRFEFNAQNRLFTKYIKTNSQTNFVYGDSQHRKLSTEDSRKSFIDSSNRLFNHQIPFNFQEQAELKKKFFFQKVDIYPNSILLSPTSQSFFDQKKLDLGVFPLRNSSSLYPFSGFSKNSEAPFANSRNDLSQKPSFFSESELTKQQFFLENKKSFGPNWSFFFSYRLNANTLLFQDEFPSKLSSHFNQMESISLQKGSQQVEKVQDFAETSENSSYPLGLFDCRDLSKEENPLLFEQSGMKEPELLFLTNASSLKAPLLKNNQTNTNSPKKVKIPFVFTLTTAESKKKNTENYLRTLSNSVSLTNDQNFSNEKICQDLSLKGSSVSTPFGKEFFVSKAASHPLLESTVEINPSEARAKGPISLKKFSNKNLTAITNDISNKKAEYQTKKAFLFNFIQNLDEQENFLLPFTSLQKVSSSVDTNKIQKYFLDTDNKEDLDGYDVSEEEYLDSSYNLSEEENLNSSYDVSEIDWDGLFFDSDESAVQSSNQLLSRPTAQRNTVNEIARQSATATSLSGLKGSSASEFFNFIEESSKKKPSSWVNSRLRSGFFYPDISYEKINSFPFQVFSEKNPIIKFFRKTLLTFSGQRNSSLGSIIEFPSLPNSSILGQVTPLSTFWNNLCLQDKDFFSQIFFRPQLLPLELKFHSNLTHWQPVENSSPEELVFKLKFRPMLMKVDNFNQGLLLRKKTTGYDMKLKNETLVKKWLKDSISTGNSLTDRQKSFFGYQKDHFQSKQFSFEKIKKSFSIPEKALRETNLDLDVTVFDSMVWYPDFSGILSTEKKEIPLLKEKEWSSIFQKFLETEVTIKKKNFIVPPLTRIAFPKAFIGPLTFVDSNPLNFQKFFAQQVEPQEFILHTLPWSRSLGNTEVISKKHCGNLYKRERTIFQEKVSSVVFPSNSFYFPSQSFTSSSWLVITQISFVLFGLKLSQYFYQEYQEVIIFLIDFLIQIGLLDKGIKNNLQLGDTDKEFRVLKGVEKRFKDVAGIDGILAELSEIVWFLKNAGRSFKLGNSIPKGILFIGPPGTGKTFLARAIAGEAEVPILVQSGSTITTAEKQEKGIQELKNLFEKARELAPCILFIDEIDTLGGKRDNLVQNPTGSDGMVEAFASSNMGHSSDLDFENMSSKKSLQHTSEVSFNTSNFLENTDETMLTSKANKSPEGLFHQPSIQSESRHAQLNILTQFLVEMDGLDARRGVLVIGATNRPDVLDPAFIRPGRFDQIIPLEYPTKQKRIEIFKLYSKNLGVEPNISWAYLANRTNGLSAADISAVMNESSIQAILKDTSHTTKTIEQGLNFIRSCTRNKPVIAGSKAAGCSATGKKLTDSETTGREAAGQPKKDPFYLKRLAFSQAGKSVLYTLLPQHPSCVFINLWTSSRSTTPENNFRSFTKNGRIFDNFSTRYALENILIGSYAEKASELLVLFKNANKPSLNSKSLFNYTTFSRNKLVLWESDLHRENMSEATLLSQFMISKWYFYSKKLSHQKWNFTITQQNDEDLKQKDTLSFFKNLTNQVEFFPQHQERSKKNFQRVSLRAWWQKNVTEQTSLIDSSIGNWSRLYLTNPAENFRNEEWIPADENYHNTNRSSNLLNTFSLKPNSPLNSAERINKVFFYKRKKRFSLYWNDLYKMNRDFLYQGLVLSSFNKAFLILDENREILDFFADYLLRYETLREHEIANIFLQFQSKFSSFKTSKNLQN